MPGNTADRAAAQCARPAEKYILVFRFDPPPAGLFFSLGKGKSRRVLEDVSMIHTESILDIDRAFAFNTEAAITRDREIIFQRLFQPLIHAFDEFLLREFSHRVVVARKQTPRRVESEQCHGVKSLFTQLWRENAVVSQRVAINFTRNFVR